MAWLDSTHVATIKKNFRATLFTRGGLTYLLGQLALLENAQRYLEDEADIYVIPVAEGQDPRRATFGAGAFQVRWDRKTGNLVVSGSWGEDSVSPP